MIHIKQVGILCTLQDLGRKGQRYLGISVCGVLDQFSTKLANILLNNNENTPVLEITMGRCAFEFKRDAWISVCGADFAANIDGKPFPLGGRERILKGQTLYFAYPHIGARAYLAVDGGFIGESYLGSMSTDLKSQFGGFSGRCLQEGDHLTLGVPHILNPLKKGAFYIPQKQKIRVMPAPEYDQFDPISHDNFWNNQWKITPNSNRMGFRLEGEIPLVRMQTNDLVSHGIIAGTIQVPPNGQPIILHQDAQATGGYPRIGFVIGADLAALSQVRLGESIEFAQCDRAEALQALKTQNDFLSYIKKNIQ